MSLLNEKVALVTGAGSGIGKAIAILFDGKGAKVVLTDINQANLEAVAAEIINAGGKAVLYAADISQATDVDLLLSYTTSTFGTLDILVNNAGIMDNFTPIDAVSDDLWKHIMAVNLDGLQNVMLPAMKLRKYSDEEIEHKAIKHLKTLGIADQALKKANQLSGGQKQRVAIARALINDPLIIMGDEPTGNLDKKNSDIVFEIFKEISVQNNQIILVVTHDPDFAKRADRIIVMEDGKII
jgi:NAD(P)-dependent dehydrogenase (short-subunit alcohol dehydrogenase family)